MLKVHENVPLAPLTTFGIGGSARYLVKVRTEEGLREAIEWARRKKLGFIVLSGGSNVLLPDANLDALVILFVGNLWSVEGNKIDTWAATNLLALIRAASALGLGGWERLAGIPGAIGGAVRGNAGAFGPEIKDFVEDVRALNIETGDFREFTNAECNFSYRNSFFKQNPQWIITRVRLQLSPVNPAESAKEIEATIAEREKRHIQNVRAAGSFFVNPVAPKEIQEMFEKEKGVKSREGRVPAGWLIEKVGLKGARVGDAMASEQHPNYLKNDGKATAEQVKELAQKIKAAVKEKFGIELQEEAVVISS
ncbi:UDP-N-acetylenolpyruvoylglucosamine reductase [Candidatus Kaiserbacteria bacterium RIFCSPHIGHO2_01_FULL_55_17]|uniref:UDP-N-acetylenolpyruvoylglucosamine reductase n=1 Tax=Candidatus Kaiserbacteria bacterium RIFCSPHIGHO2_01_FULL_55_17 TaxID=1798484 RepID=A0A1F6D8S7_9BACT|nr:MAG: UDP-N-acetylenolpyruvoylglucosamine reductase [Candidatus Kaiserbacteria bacterium RIFCSPHIGHO2_01_FULL_55_17]